jgi:hypothetical protein
LEFITVSLLYNSLSKLAQLRGRTRGRAQKEFFIIDEWNAKGKDGITINYVARARRRMEKKANDTFIHLFKDLLSSEALHRIKRTVLGIGAIFRPLTSTLSFGREGKKRCERHVEVITSG